MVSHSSGGIKGFLKTFSSSFTRLNLNVMSSQECPVCTVPQRFLVQLFLLLYILNDPHDDVICDFDIYLDDLDAVHLIWGNSFSWPPNLNFTLETLISGRNWDVTFITWKTPLFVWWFIYLLLNLRTGSAHGVKSFYSKLSRVSFIGTVVKNFSCRIRALIYLWSFFPQNVMLCV